MTTSNIYLQLGDIIQIEAQTNPELNDNIFLIDYIDSKKIKLISDKYLENIVLNISEDGNLTDESITSISILSHAEHSGYAKQNKLLPGEWIDIYFGGDIPLTITGEITNLEEDMIEIKTYPDNDIIYLDFGYKGIPDDIPIEKIIIRLPPESIQFTKEGIESSTSIVESDKEIKEGAPTSDGLTPEEIGLIDAPVVEVPISVIKTQLNGFIIDADQIEFGPDLETITQQVILPESQTRYSIETQTNDLLDELLSSIPNVERTRTVLNRIHITIERFKQLRTQYSKFDNNGNANMPSFKGADFKPLAEQINKLNFKLYWILPVAQNMKKIYDMDITEEYQSSDIVPLTLAQTINDEYDIRELYKSSADNYSTYMNKLQPYLTPYENNYNDTSLITENISQNIDAVIDNLGKFYSSIAKKDSIRQRRFLITRYNLGLSKLQTTQITSTVMKTKIIPMTKNDTMSIKSILTLPGPVVRFSNINLPKTSIYDKSNLNMKYLNYWQLFRNNTSITTKYIDNINDKIGPDEDTFLKAKTEYILNQDSNDPNKFQKYLDLVVPKTRTLFNMIKKHISGKMSLTSVVDYLQPFLIYIDDLSFKQYEEITEFIENKIREYKKQYSESKQVFNKLSIDTSNLFYESILYKLLKSRRDDSELIFNNYGLSNTIYPYSGDISKTHVLSSAEIIRKMIEVDYTKLYNTSLTVLNLDLFTPFDFDDLLNQKKEDYDNLIEKKEKENECKQYVLTKRYIALEDLNADNDISTYVDKKYDTTVYDILNEYKAEQSQMDDATFKAFLTEELIKNIGIKKSDARLEAKYMIEGKREVQEGQYAVLEIDNIDNVQYYYYKRENNNWIRDESIPSNSFFGTNKLFCNIQDKCIKIDKTCADKELGGDLIKKELIQEMYDEFDSNYTGEIEEYKNKINQKFKYELDRCIKLRRINAAMLYKYNDKHVKDSLNVEEGNIIVSPYKPKLNAIMGHSDIVIKYNELVKFISNYTRTYLEGSNEDKYWLYCITTNTKLLPTFVQKLANVFVEKGDFMQTMEQIKNDQGVDIDNITFDKYSGWEISKITLSTDEGYEESGRKIQSREMMEMDAGSIMLQAATAESKDAKELLLHNPKGRIINNVITSMINYLGIVLDSQREEIIKHVLLALDETVDSQDEYERMSAMKLKEGTKMKPYLDVFNAALLSYTLSYLALYIVISIPSIKSKKSYPGCKRSFTGYPLTGDGDMSNLEYIACVAAGIKTSQYPWKAIPKNKDKIMKLMKNSLDAYILKQTDVQVLINQKKEYLLQNEDDLIPIEHDIKRWINFLPPLQSITNKTPSTLTNEFRNLFLENLKKGSIEQFEQIRVVKSKMIYFSMAIIQSIQKVVEKEKLLLTNNNQVPYLQNACCNTGEYKAIDYFTQKEPNITQFNTIVEYLNDIVYDMKNMTQSAILLDSKNTKIKFPTISSEFSEETIYKAFIEYCNFNNDIPISNSLLTVCLNKPDGYDDGDLISEKIDRLKKEGKTYSTESFNELLDIINKMNIIPMDLVHKHSSDIHKLRDYINYMKDSDNSIGAEFLDLFNILLDSYDIENVKDNNDVRNFRNYLGNKIDILQENISSYINKYSDLTKTDKANMKDFITTITTFHVNGNDFIMNQDDETLYRSVQYIKNAMFQMVYVYPTIIMNHVDYSNIKIPTHWKLSQNHESDIKNVIKDYYTSLKPFYADATLFPLFNAAQSNLKDFFVLVNLTHLYANILLPNQDEITSILDNKTITQLFRFYFLYMINYMITLSQNKQLLNSILQNQPVESDDYIITTVELEAEMTGEITDIDVIRGEQRKLQERLANVITTMLEIERKEKQRINLNSSMVKEKINRSKDKERHKITSTLRDMTKEEREVENLFKNHRLERWNKGLQKGLTQYVAKTYDEERMDREREDIMTRHIEEKELLGQSNIVNREIELLEQELQENTDRLIEDDAYNMGDIADDDDMGENDDTYMLNYDDNE